MLVIPSPGPAGLGLRTLLAWSGAVLVPGWVAGPVAVADLSAAGPVVMARADQLASMTDAAIIDGGLPQPAAAVPVLLAQASKAEAALIAAGPASDPGASSSPAAAAPGAAPDVMLVQGSGAVVELPATAAAPGAAPTTSAAGRSPAEAAQTPGGSGFRFRLAPIRWVGNVAEIVSWSRDHSGAGSLQNVVSSSVAGSSYVWQPWFAQVAAGVGLVHGTSTATGDGQSGGGRETGFGVTGHGSLALFPVSRFPFNAAFEVSDSRTSGVAAASDFKTMRLSLRQDYAPLRSAWTFSGGYDRSVVDASSQPGKDTADAFRFSTARNWATQQLNGNAQYSSNRTATGNEFSFATASLRHGWQPTSSLTLDSYAAYSRSEQRVSGIAQPGLSLTNETSTFDLSSFAGWQPDTERPLSVGANLRYSRLEFSGIGGGASQSISAGLNAGYSVTPHLSVYGSGQVSTSDSRDTLGLFAAGLSYTPPTKPLAGFTYSWSTNANASYQTGANDGGSSLITASFAHNVFRQLYSGERSTVSMSAGQGVNVTQSSGEGNTVGLGHSVGATWTVQQSENLLTTFSGTFADTRSTGSQEFDSQQFSLQANGNMQFSRYAGAAANLTVQGTRQDNGQSGGAAGGTQWNIYGTLSYQHGRAFGIPRLRYTALYTGNTLQLNGRQQGNLNALPDQVTHSLEQRMFYRIGRLDFEGLLRFAEIDGKRNSFLFIRVNRQFGSF